MGEGSGWWEAFDDGALEYLYEVGTAQLSETIEEKGQQDRLVVYFVSWTVMIVGAGGIFGELRISDVDATSILSAAAAACALAVGVLAAAVFRPRVWLRGVTITWLSQYRGASRRVLMAEALDDLVDGFEQNSRIPDERGRLIRWLYVLTLGASGLIVAIQLVSALSR